jgi:hypothetical protein
MFADSSAIPSRWRECVDRAAKEFEQNKEFYQQLQRMNLP